MSDTTTNADLTTLQDALDWLEGYGATSVFFQLGMNGPTMLGVSAEREYVGYVTLSADGTVTEEEQCPDSLRGEYSTGKDDLARPGEIRTRYSQHKAMKAEFADLTARARALGYRLVLDH